MHKGLSTWIALLMAQVLLILGLTNTSRLMRQLVFLPIIVFLSIKVGFVDVASQELPHNRIRVTCAALTNFLRALELFLCSNEPHEDYIRDCDSAADKMSVASRKFGERLRWAIHLFFSQRGGGWKWRVTGTPPSPAYRSRWAFISVSFARCMTCYFVMELFAYVLDRYGSANTVHGPLVLMHGIFVYCSLVILFEPAAIIWVLAGIGDMDDCPPLYGAVWEAKTLRGFWGRAWHQCFRQSFTVIPDRFFKFLGLPPDRTGISAFFASGIYHAAITYTASSGTLWLGSFLFFAVQPLGLFFERYVLRIHSRPAWVGYLWVCAWFTLTARLYFDDWVTGGFYDHAEAVIELPIFGPLIRRVLGSAQDYNPLAI